MYSSILLKVTAYLVACLLQPITTHSSSFGILLTYVDTARTCITENTSRDGYPACPLARWLLPTENTCYMTATYCSGDIIVPVRKCLLSRGLEAGCITPLFYCCMLDHVCVAGIAQQWIYVSQYICSLWFLEVVYHLLLTVLMSACFSSLLIHWAHNSLLAFHCCSTTYEPCMTILSPDLKVAVFRLVASCMQYF
jgi:hypothetical protein